MFKKGGGGSPAAAAPKPTVTPTATPAVSTPAKSIVPSELYTVSGQQYTIKNKQVLKVLDNGKTQVVDNKGIKKAVKFKEKEADFNTSAKAIDDAEEYAGVKGKSFVDMVEELKEKTK